MNIDIETLISTTPIVQIKQFGDNQVFSLLEKYNVVCSIKVKTVYWILKDAYNKGLLDKQKTILEASSGNTAIALAYLGSVLDYKVQIILPKSTSPCKKRLIKSYNAEIIEIDGTTDDGIIVRNQMAEENPSKYFLPDQFQNYGNFWAHYNLTGPHLYQKLGNLDFFVAGLGTSGTLLGTAKYLKEKNPKIQIIGVNPLDKIEGLRNFKTTQLKIPFYEEYKYLIDEIIDVSFDPCVIHGVQVYLDEGYFVGLSSAAILSASKKFLHSKTNLRGAIIAPDGGDFYLDILAKYMDLENFIGCK